MSIAAVGAVGGLGIGSIGGMRVARQPSPVQTASSAPSTMVELSDAAKSSGSSEGLHAGASMSELAQALIVALMLQLLQGN
ncbi:MAG: hypothetical protein ACOYNZ_08925 [Rhodoferax sp.]